MTPIFAILQFGDFAVIAFIVIVFGGGAAMMTRQNVKLRRLEQKVDALLKHQGVLPPPALSEEVQRLASDPARKIEALKLHREQTGLGLAEAKAEIEAFVASKGSKPSQS